MGDTFIARKKVTLMLYLELKSAKVGEQRKLTHDFLLILAKGENNTRLPADFGQQRKLPRGCLLSLANKENKFETVCLFWPTKKINNSVFLVNTS